MMTHPVPVPAYGHYERAYARRDQGVDELGDRMPFIWQGADYEEFQKFEEFDTLTEEPGCVMVVNSTSSGAYASLCGDAATADLVAFDAEWVPDWTMGSDNPISVLQLAFPTSRRVYVLQLEPLSRKLPQAVQMMLVNPEVTKVGFAVSHKDAAKLMRSGIVVTKGTIVDVQDRCAAALGVAWSAGSSLSLKQAAQCLLGCVLFKDKRCACSDWSSEKLTPEQVRYAALDAWVALRLYYRTLC
jgi:ribonuclease D